MSRGVQEKKIAESYVKAIPLQKTSQDAMKLIKYKNPKYAGAKVCFRPLFLN